MTLSAAQLATVQHVTCVAITANVKLAKSCRYSFLPVPVEMWASGQESGSSGPTPSIDWSRASLLAGLATPSRCIDSSGKRPIDPFRAW